MLCRSDYDEFHIYGIYSKREMSEKALNRLTDKLVYVDINSGLEKLYFPKTHEKYGANRDIHWYNLFPEHLKYEFTGYGPSYFVSEEELLGSVLSGDLIKVQGDFKISENR